MCKIEDLLYEAYYEGIREDVLAESRRLYKSDMKFERMEFIERIELALKTVRGKKRNESI
tara:strand:+ start:927 stop:1106 length:180 start_codon:yes stop_codon:yes gene_type:complete